jgi:hypothetical protein
VTDDTGAVEAAAPTSDYPATLWAEKPEAPSRLLAVLLILVIKILMAIPHLIVLAFYGFAAAIMAWIGYWIVLFTGEMPAGFRDFVLGSLRWNWRVSAWIYGIADAYPPFSVDADYPVDADCATPEEGNRLLAVARIFGIASILLIPHFIALWVMNVLAMLVLLITPWAVIFTGGYPDFSFEILTGVARWQHRVSCFQMGLVEQYPPFRMGH